MKTLVIYDNAGIVFSQMTGAYTVPSGGINYLEVEIPEGKYISKIDVTVTPNVAILTDFPKTETQNLTEKLQALTASYNEVSQSNAELMGIISSIVPTLTSTTK